MKDKKIIIGISGGIAAYKAAELVRLLIKKGAGVKVAMTLNATRFVGPLTFEALTGDRVIWDMWNSDTPPMAHIRWGQESDLIIIAPATANFISKMAMGAGDDFLSTMVLASTARILVCPAMNDRMYLNPAVQANIRTLRSRDISVMEPAQGELACNSEGPGRLPEPLEILEKAKSLFSQQDLSGLQVLVTAGATMEPIDPVRFITNRSSGKMGYAIAGAARRRGAQVVLVSGPSSQRDPAGVSVERVNTTEEMRDAVFRHRLKCDIIIKAAAVSDYRPRENMKQKIKKREGALSLDLVQNPDILAELGCAEERDRCFLVGFAAETENLLANAEEKLKKKNLDMIVANDVSREDAGFESDTNLVKIITRDGRLEELPLMTKDEVAHQLLDRIIDLREGVR